jgi:lambda family phage tail tape measure protein
MTSNRTVKFEFLVDADARQIDRFHDALRRMGDGSATSEKTLTSLREELQRFASISDKTENNLQAQISALRGAAANADLTRGEYVQLRREAHALQEEYKLLTTNIVGLDRTYKVATQSARQFSQEQIAAAQRTNNLYLNNSGQRSADATNRAQFLAGTSGAASVFPVDPTSQLGFQQRIANLRQEATLVGMGTDAYKERALAINKLEQEYQQLSRVEDQSTIDNRSRAGRRQRIREIGNVASNVAIGGFFGGPEGLAGSAAGAFAGSFFGPGGMVAGAQLGASVGLAAQQARIQATAVADMVAQLNLAKTALAQVSANQTDYNQKLQFARQVSTDYSVGLQATIEGYSKVTAAAAANGLTLKETETIYRGLLASGVAFGASQDDLQSIITATTQILSKGKISAEELSSQLGERIPGAVAKFAQATGRPLAQLAKDLQDGKVNIADFVKFARGQLDDYDKAAKLIGSSPEKAGERLNLALTRSGELYGTFFQKVGAGFQDVGTAIVQWANNNVGALARIASASALFINDLKYQFNQFKDFTHEGVTKLIPGIAPSKTTAQPGQYTISPEMVTQTREQTAREAWRIKFETENFYSGFNPTLFNQSKTNPALGDQTAADDEKAKKAADTETKLREQLASEERRRAELLANNAIRLADRVFEHQQNLIRRRYELENSLIEATRRAQESALIGPAREALAFANRLKAVREDEIRQIRDASENTALMRQGLRSSVAQAANTARYAEVPQSAAGGSRSGFPEFISASQMRAWLKSQGYERTSGDFTNKGHRTPNHMLNAIDTGEMDGSYSNAVQRAKDLEARLRRTGAFDDQLFGPTRDPKGHKDHVHIPTPGGRIRVTPGLAEVMQLGTTLSRTQPGVASGLGRLAADMGDVRMSEANLRGAREQQELTEAKIGPISQQRAIAETNTFTESYRAQTKVLQDQQRELTLRNELVLKGVRPEVIDQQASLNQLIRDYTETLTTLQGELGKIDSKKEPQKYKDLADSIKLVTDATDRRIAAQIALDTVSNVNTYKTQTKSIQDQLSEFKLRNRLQMEGVRPEIVDQQVELDRVTRAYTATLNSLQVQLASINERQKPEQYAAKLNQINQETAAYKEQIAAQEALNKAQNDERNIFSFDKSAKAGIDGYIESIGTLNNATSNLVQSGFNGISTALRELQSTGSTDFRKFALGLISDMQDIITKQLIVATAAKLLRGLFGGFGGGGPVGLFGGGGVDFAGAMNMPKLFANGGVMTSSGPLKLQTYARGGIADRPQLALFGEGSRPEAYVPLPDGRRIPVAMQGGAGAAGGDTNITINVDATGTRAAGDQGRSKALADDLAQIIDARLIYHRRPNGILAS